MSALSENRLVFHKVTGILLLALLAGCGGAAATSDDPQTAELTRIAQQLHKRGDDADAANFYARALKREPNNPQIHEAFGEILEGHGDLNNAATQYRLGLGLPPTESTSSDITSDNVELLRAYGRILLKLGQPASAQPVYARAVQVDPDDVRSLNGLGVTLDQLNNHDAAQKIYREALEDKPDDMATLANLGHSYVLSGAYQQAISLLEPHVSDKDATPTLRQNLAEAYGMAGMDADAERISKLDLTPEQVKRNLAFYRSRRTHISGGAALYADLGHFPTAQIAEARVNAIKDRFADETEGLNIATIPEVDAIGGTPIFVVHVTGFEKTSTLRAFCLKLKKQDFSCTPKTEM